MGFKKSLVPKEICVPLRFNYHNTDTGDMTAVDVQHYFRLPTPTEREEYNRKLVRVRGRKVMHGVEDANFYLWMKCCVRVEGYDDLPKMDEGVLGAWKSYFQDEIGRIHIDAAVSRFNDLMGAEEVDEEKKSEPS